MKNKKFLILSCIILIAIGAYFQFRTYVLKRLEQIRIEDTNAGKGYEANSPSNTSNNKY